MNPKWTKHLNVVSDIIRKEHGEKSLGYLHEY